MEKIKLENVSKSFANGVSALRECSLEFYEGKFHAIMGPSGSGKSTLLNIIGLLDVQTEGNMYINGNLIKDTSEKERAFMRMKTIGFIFQSFYLNPRLRVLDNVMMPMHINKEYQNISKKEAAISYLESFGMKDYIKRFPNELSGGEQQRVCIARAMVNNPEIILADEPTGNLDEENEKIIFAYLKELAEKGKTVIVVSHNEMVQDYADTVIKVNKGSVC